MNTNDLNKQEPPPSSGIPIAETLKIMEDYFKPSDLRKELDSLRTFCLLLKDKLNEVIDSINKMNHQ